MTDDFEMITDGAPSRINQDSLTLLRAFSSMYNNATGLGLPTDKGNYARINPLTNYLGYAELLALPRSNAIVANMIDLLPNEASGIWARIEWGKSAPVDESEIWGYLRNLKFGEGEIDAKTAFKEASSLGRQLGDGFILLGIADGMKLSDPVDYRRIRSLEWMRVLEGYRVVGNIDPVWSYDGMSIHKSRFLRFPGKRLFGDALRFNNYRHDSVLQAAYEDFSRFIQGLQAGSHMLLDYDVFSFGMNGLGQVIKADVQNQTTKGEDWVRSRADSINVGKSVARMLLYDLQNEKPDHISRTYSGAENIMDRLEKFWVASTGIPRHKLLGESLGGGLASSTLASAILNHQWAQTIKRWQEATWTDPLERLVQIVLSAKDFSKTTAKTVDWSLNFPLSYSVSPYEQADLENLAAQRSQILVDIGAFTPMEIRNAYKNPEFTINLVPLEEHDAAIEEAHAVKIAPPPPPVAAPPGMPGNKPPGKTPGGKPPGKTPKNA